MKHRYKVLKIIIILIIISSVLGISGYITVKTALKQYYPMKYEDTVLALSDKYNIEPDILFALIHTESKFNEKVVSSKGAVGLMQITPETLKWAVKKENNGDDVTEADLIVPETNIKYGTLILSYHIKEFGDLKTALCAYNAGRSNVKKWLADKRYSKDGKKIDDIPYKETKRYVDKIMKAKEIYKWLYFKNK